MNNKLFELDNRLSLCAELVRKDSRLADIGTDHAYLPVWLCQNKLIKSAVAADIKEAPLKSGISTIKKFGADAFIEARISDGLSEISPDEVDDIVIAGMGGELIAKIIDHTKWLRNKKYHLVLQPMSKSEKLREYLYENGFCIELERAVEAEGKLYTVMSVYYFGECISCNEDIKTYYGEINPLNSECDRRYISKTANSLYKKGSGILSADPYSREAKKYLEYANAMLKYSETGEEPIMTTVYDIYKYIDSFAPFDTAMDFDNVGILVGDKNACVNKVIVALDVTANVVREAQKEGANLIISHHPVIFKPMKKLDSNHVVYMLAQCGLNVISAHTNLDISNPGVNTCFAEAMCLEEFTLTDGMALGNLSEENPLTPKQLAEYTKEKLHCEGVRYTDSSNKIKRVALAGGACGSYIYRAKELGADAFVTGEVKHNVILEANDMGLTIIEAGHYKTEDLVTDLLVEKLSRQFEKVEFKKSKTFSDCIKYI